MRYTNLYSTRIQKTFDEDQDYILSVLKTEIIKNKTIEVQLINYYNGLPVSFKANIVMIDKKAIELDVAPQQAVAISAEHYTFIRSKLFKNDILAKAQYVNIKKKAVSLNKLCFVEIIAERRNHLRLALNSLIKAIFVSSTDSIRGKLIELSVAGAVLEVEDTPDTVIGKEAKLLFMLPDEGQNTKYNINVPAKLISISDDHKPFQFKIMTTPDRTSDKQISKYLFNRQLEIIQKLKDLSELG